MLLHFLRLAWQSSVAYRLCTGPRDAAGPSSTQAFRPVHPPAPTRPFPAPRARPAHA